MKTVYYSASLPPDLYGNDIMLYQEPDSLYKELLATKNKENTYNNYMDCPAFLKSIQNTFVVRCPWTSRLTVDYSNGTFLNGQGHRDEIAEHFTPKPTSRSNPMFNVYHNFLFFCEEDLEITTSPAFLHNSEFQSNCTYIPGTFNISKWFRPIEGAFEMKTPMQTLDITMGDPLYYIKFNTTDLVKLVRFDLTTELWSMTQGCVNHKKYQPNKSLAYLYKLFFHSGRQRQVLKKIKENII
jgi:hypothetical protein